MEQNGRKTVQFWLDGKQAFGVEVKTLGDETLVSYHGKFFEVCDGSALSSKGFSEATIPAKWLQADQQEAKEHESDQMNGAAAEPSPAQPSRQPIDLFGTRSAAAAAGTSKEAVAPDSPDTGSIAAVGEETGQEIPLESAGSAAILPAEVKATDAPSPSVLETAGEAEEPAGGKGQEPGASELPVSTLNPSPGAGPRPDDELDKRRKKREPRVKSDPPKTGDTLLDSDEREFEYTCPHCGEVHDRIIKPNGEKGHWELAAGKKVETIQEHFFTTCSSCKQTFAVKVVPVTVYVAKVAGF